MIRIEYNQMDLTHTLALLEQGGQHRRECVVLWLGKRKGDVISITNVHMPQHRAASDYFHIPPESMNDLKTHLRQNRLVVGAQIHTHPSAAYHSQADDEWAFVRHEGAISIVLPRFAIGITPSSFMEQAATFVLSPRNTWDLVTGSELSRRCVLTN